MGLRLVIAGATGRIGRLLARVWSDRPPKGITPVFTSRRPGGPVLPELAACRWAEPDRFAALLAGADLVLDLAGPTRAPGAELHHQHLQLFEALVPLAPCPVVTMSSSAVYGPGADLREDGPVAPLAAYGRAKLEVEAAVRKAPGAVALRLGNVAGADALLGGAALGRVIRLDRFADGATPGRSYLGPVSLAHAIAALAPRAAAGDLPPVLNLCGDRPVQMAELLEAAGLEWEPAPAPETAIREVGLSPARLSEFIPVPAGDAATVVAEWQRVRS